MPLFVSILASQKGVRGRTTKRIWYRQKDKVEAMLRKRSKWQGFQSVAAEDVAEWMEQGGKPIKMALIDVSRAHFDALATEPTYVQLPDEHLEYTTSFSRYVYHLQSASGSVFFWASLNH